MGERWFCGLWKTHSGHFSFLATLSVKGSVSINWLSKLKKKALFGRSRSNCEWVMRAPATILAGNRVGENEPHQNQNTKSMELRRFPWLFKVNEPEASMRHRPSEYNEKQINSLKWWLGSSHSLNIKRRSWSNVSDSSQEEETSRFLNRHCCGDENAATDLCRLSNYFKMVLICIRLCYQLLNTRSQRHYCKRRLLTTRVRGYFT